MVSRAGLWSRALLIAAALYLALVQMLTAAHAASAEGTEPDHDPAECVLHLVSDRASAPPPVDGPLLAEPFFAAAAAAPAPAALTEAARNPLPPPRGPPPLI